MLLDLESVFFGLVLPGLKTKVLSKMWFDTYLFSQRSCDMVLNFTKMVAKNKTKMVILSFSVTISVRRLGI